MTLDPRIEQFLLGRATRAELPAPVRSALTRRRVLITGAGGSVGAELARRVAVCRPAELVLFDHAEYLLFRAAQSLRDGAGPLSVHAILGDVSRREDVTAAINSHAPDFVFHAAACKHVTIAEECIIPAVRTNVLGAVLTARAAAAAGARFILISTDKATEPHSVMGATKRLAELCVLNASGGAGAIAVRFGNVLGSSGSVVEILMEAARAGRPLSVTDPGATRFFMTAGEAATLVLKAAVSGRANEVFWLDMGSPLRLGDLVERILEAATAPGGAKPPIVVTGLRPGEKRNEELTTQDLAMEATDDPGIWRARQASGGLAAARCFEQLRRACDAGDAASALDALERAVPDYTPSTAARAAAARASEAARTSRLEPAHAPMTGARLRRPA